MSRPPHRFIDSVGDIANHLEIIVDGRGVQLSVLAKQLELLTMAAVVAGSDGFDPAQLAQGCRFLLEETLDTFGDGPIGQAARRLFGVGPTWHGQPVANRRSGAAAALSIKVDTFRRNYEPQIIEEVATVLWAREVTCREYQL